MNVKPDGEDVSELESKIGYEFRDRSLLERALTHRSFANEHRSVNTDNQRLEFLGDAVLGVVIAETLFLADEAAAEGALSSRLAELVCEGALVERAEELELGQFVRLGRGEELTGGRSKAGLLADAYEALLGAIFIDSGHEQVRDLILAHFGGIITEVASDDGGRESESPGDFKSLLQREVQSQRPVRPEYRIAETTGPPHDRRFVAEAVVEGDAIGRGIGRSKKEAEQAAAAEALETLAQQEEDSPQSGQDDSPEPPDESQDE